jgi:hypothetical protein
MRDLDKALADIFAIRSQIAAGTAFRGYGAATVAATGGLALFPRCFNFCGLTIRPVMRWSFSLAGRRPRSYPER